MRLLVFYSIFFSFYTSAQEHLAEFITDIEPAVTEVSGMVSTLDDRIFVIGDSGNDASVYEINTSGEILNTINISNAENVDWEELQLDSDGNLYIGDIGNNLSQRTDLIIYKIPHFTDSLHLSDMNYAELISFTYEDQESFTSDQNGEFDSEAFIVIGNEIHIFSKDHSLGHQSKIYSIPLTSGNYIAELLEVQANQRWLTGVYYDHLTDIIYFTSLNGVRSFSNYSFARLTQENCSIDLPILENIQIESITQLSSGEFLIPEDVENNLSSKLYSLFTSCLAEVRLTIAPNPSSLLLTISSEHIINGIRLFDNKGNLVFQVVYSVSTKKEDLNIFDLSPGVFILEITSGGQVMTERILKL